MKENGKSDKILVWVKVQTDNTHGAVEYLVLRQLKIIVEFGTVKASDQYLVSELRWVTDL